jgi:iduronate 2-sulfatase
MKIGLLSLLLVIPCSHGLAAEDRPNVLFIMVDDLRPELGCHGFAHAITPRIDALAKRGLLFDRAYCQQAHCSASRFSMLSGCRPDTAKIWTNQDPREALRGTPFFPEHFKNHGYHTIGLGKIAHNNQEEPACWSEPHRMPENYPYEYRTRAGQALVARLQREAAETGLPDPFADVPANIRRGMPYESLEVEDHELGDGQLADAAIEALEKMERRPFFLAVGFLRPHLPFVAPKKYWDMQDLDKFPEIDPLAAHGGIPGMSSTDSRELRTQYRGVPASGPLPPELIQNLWHGYLACATYVDAQIGRILDTLERLQLADRTIVVLASDHGFHLGETGIWCKATNFEAAARVTLLVSAPGMKAAGGRTQSIVELVGLYPTLCELAGLPAPRHLQGASFACLLDDPSMEPVGVAFSQYPRGDNMGRAIRTDRHRLVEWRDRKTGQLAGRELYDLLTDPWETTNLSRQPEHGALIEELSERLARL